MRFEILSFYQHCFQVTFLVKRLEEVLRTIIEPNQKVLVFMTILKTSTRLISHRHVTWVGTLLRFPGNTPDISWYYTKRPWDSLEYQTLRDPLKHHLWGILELPETALTFIEMGSRGFLDPLEISWNVPETLWNSPGSQLGPLEAPLDPLEGIWKPPETPMKRLWDLQAPLWSPADTASNAPEFALCSSL